MMTTALEENTGYFLSPEMFGAVGDGVHDDSDAIQTAIDHARVNKYRKVVGKGNYLINKTLLISSDGNGFALHLQSLIVGEQFPALPEKWWDAAPAIAPHKSAGSQNNIDLRVEYFNGANKATWFRNWGNGITASKLYCGSMKNYIIGYRCYRDTQRVTGMNDLAGCSWQGGYLGALIGTGERVPGFTTVAECHSFDIQWFASNKYGGVILLSGAQYANIYKGTYDYNGKFSVWMNLGANNPDTENNGKVIGFGDTISDGVVTGTVLTEPSYHQGNYYILVTDTQNALDGNSTWTAGKPLSTPDGSWKASAEKIITCTTTEARYFDVVANIRTGGFGKCIIEPEYIGGLIGHNLFTSQYRAASATSINDTSNYRGLGVASTADRLEMTATSHSNTPFISAYKDETQVRTHLRLFNQSKLLGLNKSVNVPNNSPTWIFSLGANSSATIAMWKVYVTSTTTGISGEANVTVRGNEAFITNVVYAANMQFKVDGLKLLVHQSTGASRNIFMNAIRVA